MITFIDYLAHFKWFHIKTIQATYDYKFNHLLPTTETYSFTKQSYRFYEESHSFWVYVSHSLFLKKAK